MAAADRLFGWLLACVSVSLFGLFGSNNNTCLLFIPTSWSLLSDEDVIRNKENNDNSNRVTVSWLAS